MYLIYFTNSTPYSLNGKHCIDWGPVLHLNGILKNQFKLNINFILVRKKNYKTILLYRDGRFACKPGEPSMEFWYCFNAKIFIFFFIFCWLCRKMSGTRGKIIFNDFFLECLEVQIPTITEERKIVESSILCENFCISIARIWAF